MVEIADMTGSDENNPFLVSHPNQVDEVLQARRVGKALPIGHNRKALKEICDNNHGTPFYSFSCQAKKRTTFDNESRVTEMVPTTPKHRPVTRKYSAGKDFWHQVSTEKEKEPDLCDESANEELDDCVIIGANDHKVNNDSYVPMFVQHTKAMLEEIDRMDNEEVEMEDVDQEAILDIDSDDQSNPLAVTDYVEDLYAYYKKMEGSSCVPSDYMERQPDINEKMRAILIDWLIEVHYKFELMEETLYLTVNLVDRFLALRPVIRKKLQLVGVTAMLLACKYEEVSVPVVEDLVLISDKAYTRHEVLEMEKLMINSLKFNLSIPTLYVFMRRFLKAADANKQLELMAFFLIELCLIEHEMLRFSPSLLAAAAVFSAMCTLSGSTQWSKTCEWHTGYSLEELIECSRLIVKFHQKAAAGKLTGVHRKYNTSKYGYTARSVPALFLLDTVCFRGWFV